MSSEIPCPRQIASKPAASLRRLQLRQTFSAVRSVLGVLLKVPCKSAEKPIRNGTENRTSGACFLLRTTTARKGVADLPRQTMRLQTLPADISVFGDVRLRNANVWPTGALMAAQSDRVAVV
jgi:hypothetical protein